MNQLVVTLLYGIALMSLCSFSTAETTLEPDNGECLTFTEISSSNINLAWDPACFKDSTIYEIIQIGDKTCTKSEYECPDSGCSIDTIGMGCFPINDYLKPCQNVTYSITGNLQQDIPISRDTTVAPLIRTADWNLDTTIDNENGIITVSWGPPADISSTDVECATNANVSATCSGDGEVPEYAAEDLNPPGNGNAVLNVTDCSPGNIIITVYYILDIPTKTSRSTTILYTGPSTTESSTTFAPVTFTTEPTVNGTDPNVKRLSGGEIAGIVIGSIAGVGLIAGSIAYCYIKKILCFEL